MISETRYKIKNQTWYPKFEENDVEHEFIQEFNFEAIKSGRLGIFIILAVWVGFAFFDLRLNDQVRSSALFFRLVVVTPLLLIILAAMYSKYVVAIYQMLIIFCLFIIEGSLYYVVKFYDFQIIAQSLDSEYPIGNAEGQCIFIFVWLLIIFMGSMTVRLNILQSVINGLVILILSVLSILNYQPSLIIIIIEIPFLITTFTVVWLGSLHVQQYTRQNFRAAKLLAHSMQESESLLLNILPVQIASRLKTAPGTIADGFNHVSVLFADIVGFTKLSQRHRPEVMVKMLNQIFTRFDQISSQYGAEKIKTIGDAYMLAAGIPEVSTNHCEVVANCALEMLDATTSFTDPDGNPLQIRIGIHTGSVIAGVIGTHKFSYDLWGGTVNTASLMESHGNAGKIQVTEEIYRNLKGRFVFEDRDAIEVKGIGKMNTYWLKSRACDN